MRDRLALAGPAITSVLLTLGCYQSTLARPDASGTDGLRDPRCSIAPTGPFFVGDDPRCRDTRIADGRWVHVAPSTARHLPACEWRTCPCDFEPCGAPEAWGECAWTATAPTEPFRDPSRLFPERCSFATAEECVATCGGPFPALRP